MVLRWLAAGEGPATVKVVVKKLMLLFSRVGIAREVLTDQGSCFMSQVMKELLSLLQVKQLRTLLYHPQTDGLVERFNKTLKQMLKKAMDVDGKNWTSSYPMSSSPSARCPKPPRGSPPSSCCTGEGPGDS